MEIYRMHRLARAAVDYTGAIAPSAHRAAMMIDDVMIAPVKLATGFNRTTTVGRESFLRSSLLMVNGNPLAPNMPRRGYAENISHCAVWSGIRDDASSRGDRCKTSAAG
jgi:hypothetical protein